MRFFISNIEQARSKAKFLQKCLKRFDIERSLTQCQSYLASAFGFNSWAEMKSVYNREENAETFPVSIRHFKQMASTDFGCGAVGNIHAYAIFARMGYCRSVHHFDYKFEGFYREFITPTEAAAALELIFERYLEMTNQQSEADGLIAMAQAIIAPYVDIHPGAFELNAMRFIDQMKAMRMPPELGMIDDCKPSETRPLPSSGVFTVPGATVEERHLNAIRLMKQARQNTKFCLPLRWLVDQNTDYQSNAVFYLPAVTAAGRSLINAKSEKHSILVVENAPDNTQVIQEELAEPISSVEFMAKIKDALPEERVDEVRFYDMQKSAPHALWSTKGLT